MNVLLFLFLRRFSHLFIYYFTCVDRAIIYAFFILNHLKRSLKIKLILQELVLRHESHLQPAALLLFFPASKSVSMIVSTGMGDCGGVGGINPSPTVRFVSTGSDAPSVTSTAKASFLAFLEVFKLLAKSATDKEPEPSPSNLRKAFIMASI